MKKVIVMLAMLLIAAFVFSQDLAKFKLYMPEEKAEQEAETEQKREHTRIGHKAANRQPGRIPSPFGDFLRDFRFCQFQLLPD